MLGGITEGWYSPGGKSTSPGQPFKRTAVGNYSRDGVRLDKTTILVLIASPLVSLVYKGFTTVGQDVLALHAFS